MDPSQPPSDSPAILHGRYDLGRVLGHGTFGKVHLARNLSTNALVAIKILNKDKIMQVNMMEQLKREISLMKLVRHPNVVELYEVMATRSKIFLSMELVRGGELFAKIARNGRLKEDVARHYFRQLVSAIDFCHSRGVYHRDLKPENLLLDEKGVLKIADFGLSAFAEHVRPDGLLHTACGTPAYIAPEVFGKKGYDGAKADLWSCGVILYLLLAGFLPFQDDNLIGMYKKIYRGDFKCPPWFSSDARRVVVRLLDPNPSTRITVAKLVETSWFKKNSVPKGFVGNVGVVVGEKKKEIDDVPETMNAFHLISLSEGFDLSPLFVGERKEEGLRFCTKESASGIVSRFEGVVAKTAGKYKVTKSGVSGVTLEGEDRGRKGKLAVAAEIFAVAPSVHVVEVRKDGGDSIEYQRFCADELRPALKDIMWASTDCQTAVA